jgi:hypothetical protein
MIVFSGCRTKIYYRLLAAILCLCRLSITTVSAGDIHYEEPPISYGKTVPENAITRLQAKVDAGEIELKYESGTGYLRSLLTALEIPVDSQVLTFAKVSKQKPKIAPLAPRAIYFNDDVHIGYVRDGLIEIAVSDPRLGMAFYTLEQNEVARPQIEHDSSSCLTCHGVAKTRNVPGLQVRSVVTDSKGEPILAAGTTLVNHATPIAKRWGGWYVTGQHGQPHHLGNFSLSDPKKFKQIDNAIGQNRLSLDTLFDVSPYLTPHSDITALMVLEHQADAHNLITRLSYVTRDAYYQAFQSDAVNMVLSPEQESTIRKQIAPAVEQLVHYLTFSDEIILQEPIRGTTAFAESFSQRGPRDTNGDSLYQLDLTSRLSLHACSYMVYSSAFQSLPPIAKRSVYGSIRSALSDETVSAAQARFSKRQREKTLAILEQTIEEFPQ